MDVFDGPDLRDDEMGARAAGGRLRQSKPWLMIWFRCCHCYGRINRNQAGTGYEGRCPKCGVSVRARIGKGGSARRIFEAK